MYELSHGNKISFKCYYDIMHTYDQLILKKKTKSLRYSNSFFRIMVGPGGILVIQCTLYNEH